jgi:UDP-N-acetylmuramate--alanine ligase
MISKTAKPGDYVICMGAGDITAYANALPAQLDEELAKSKGAVA